jgi:hypothetical protein
MVDINTAIAHLTSSAKLRQLVVVVGTGVSVALTGARNKGLSWRGLVENGFEYGVAKGKISASQRKAWSQQLMSNDLDDLLSAAEFMGRKLDAPLGDLYARWLEGVFKDAMPEEKGMANAIKALRSAEIPICTLNYDLLLERVTGLRSINLSEVTKVISWMRREEQGILHLHGTWDTPSSCILGVRDYQSTVGDDVRDLIQRALTSFGRILFIGCGDTFADPNFSALIEWLRRNIKTGTPQHYALVSAEDEARRNADPTWHGFVEPVSFGANHSDLPAFLLSLFPTAIPPKVKSKAVRSKASSLDTKHAKVLADYRAFLIRDCGQMTIEGVRADMDTAQRRFDLEKLFVPLEILPTPPEIPLNDPNRDKKLAEWSKKNEKSSAFGTVFKKCKRLALLALPGGGKTLLLKRLAVAYADAARRDQSDDQLPDLDLMPVLIRCREWKEHIRSPISVILQNMATITGQKSLADLEDALAPLLKKGHVLLLVDGLDEIHNDGDRSTFVENLEKFLQDYKNVHLVVTSREAGFSLVAPSIARFCERWRVAPLKPEAITALCDYWHRLMTGESTESAVESRDVIQRLLRNSSLRRLAENPLLLTMLLVVKRGAGRLPPDRVTLYDRAVEVLLDTWNIKGHEPLNTKEAVPQLACVAFELMNRGKQTATEKELLTLLEEARERMPQIRRYAKDSPDQFLKRVELRSSLLVEAGHQQEDGRTVPFYQFRHLTFQEHLAAVAAVQGHYMNYKQGDTVLEPLSSHLTAEEWKEVVPMAAVLAKKQGEPLVAALTANVEALRETLVNEKKSPILEAWVKGPDLPAAVARLVQCLVEEAEVSPATLAAALQGIALFARGCRSLAVDWRALCQGPYGEDLLACAWNLYRPMNWPTESWVDLTLAAILVGRRPEDFWGTPESKLEIERLLGSQSNQEVAYGLLCIVGIDLAVRRNSKIVREFLMELLEGVERHFFSEEKAIWDAACYAWTRFRIPEGNFEPKPEILNRLLSLWLADHSNVTGNASYAINTIAELPRHKWTPRLTQLEVKIVRDAVNSEGDQLGPEGQRFAAALTIAFYAQSVFSEAELYKQLKESDPNSTESISKIIKQMEMTRT